MATINVVTYWRPSPRHLWRRAGTRVNVPEGDTVETRINPSFEIVGGIEYAHVPYDWQVWTPPKRARVLAGVSPQFLAQARAMLLANA